VRAPGKSEEPAKGSLLAEGVRCRGNGCLSRDGGGSGIGQASRPILSIGKPDWRHGRHRLGPGPRTSGVNSVGPAPGMPIEARSMPWSTWPHRRASSESITTRSSGACLWQRGMHELTGSTSGRWRLGTVRSRVGIWP